MDAVRDKAGLAKDVDALDVGVGVLLFFASHMVIRIMYYVGLGRTPGELAAFLVIVVAGIVLAHAFSRFLLRLRFTTESWLAVPVVSAVAVLGAVLALVSILPVAYSALFYMAAVFLGLSCGWAGVIWASSTSSSRLDAAAFRINPSLAMAVLFYFLFRIVSTFSNAAAEGFLLAMPLIAIACMLRAFRKADGPDRLSGRMQALRVPAIVSAAFALAGGVAVEASGHGDVVLESGMNYMVFFEGLAVFLILSCCEFMKRFSPYCRRGKAGPLVSFFVVYVLMFVMGAAMGGMAIPAASPNALWESNVWVILIAVFAYDIRDSLYAVEGLAVGLMFEAMCVGQIIAWIATLDLVPFSVGAAVVLTLLYFASAAHGFFQAGPCVNRGSLPNVSGKETGTDSEWEACGGECCGAKPARHDKTATDAMTSFCSEERIEGDRATSGDANENDAEGTRSYRVDDAGLTANHAVLDSDDDAGLTASRTGIDFADDDVAFADVPSRESLAERFGLTEREAEILELVAMGRSARYIADDLMISYNTVRTHIKHVYEKLNIHSKQELIDLACLGK